MVNWLELEKLAYESEQLAQTLDAVYYGIYESDCSPEDYKSALWLVNMLLHNYKSAMKEHFNETMIEIGKLKRGNVA